ncbi:transposase [Streptomyces sp. SID12501]|nr:transposase [Streptomyces sp. SID12501]
MSTILYADRSSCRRACLPHDFPPHQGVCGHLAGRQKDGVLARFNGTISRSSAPGTRAGSA